VRTEAKRHACKSAVQWTSLTRFTHRPVTAENFLQWKLAGARASLGRIMDTSNFTLVPTIESLVAHLTHSK